MGSMWDSCLLGHGSIPLGVSPNTLPSCCPHPLYRFKKELKFLQSETPLGTQSTNVNLTNGKVFPMKTNNIHETDALWVSLWRDTLLC